MGKRAIEDWPQIAGLPPVSGSSDIDIIHDHPSPADMDFIPDAVSSHLSDRNADRYNAGPNPPLSSGTRGLIDRMRGAKQQAQILPLLRQEAMPVSSRRSIGVRLEKSPPPTSSTSRNPNRIRLVLALLHLTSSTSPSISHPGEEMKMMKPFEVTPERRTTGGDEKRPRRSK